MKKKTKLDSYIYRPSTISIYYSMIDCPKWLKFLTGKEKEYSHFLDKIIQNDFYRTPNKKVSVKYLCEQTGYRPTQITKWISCIYADILNLNDDEPELFREKGILHQLYFKHFESGEYLNLWLHATPRVYEDFDFFFLNAKLGCRTFWVKKIQHEIKDGKHEILIFLEGGFANPYRETLFQKALFYHRIGILEELHTPNYEIDEILKTIYKE